MDKKVCKRCNKTYTVDKFYRCRKPTDDYPDGVLTVCKNCLENNFKSSDPTTFMHILKALDIPWIPSEYRTVYDKNVKPSSPNSIAILGKYIMKMKLIQYNKFGFFDTEKAQADYEQPENYDSIENYNYNAPLDKPLSTYSTNSSFHLTEVSSQDRPAAELLEALELEDPASSLTIDEYKYLILKWGKAYNKEQLMRLEKTYLEMCEDYDIRTTTQKDYLKKYCQASLRYDECLCQNDYDAAKKASSMFTAINKEAGFQPIQNKGQNDDYLNSISYMVKLAESEGPISADLWKDSFNYSNDIVDLSIKDIKRWQKMLVEDDDTIMERANLAKEELLKQDALVKNGEISSDETDELIDANGTSENEQIFEGIDMSVFDSLEEKVEKDDDF